jgi:hypothetical protein
MEDSGPRKQGKNKKETPIRILKNRRISQPLNNKQNHEWRRMGNTGQNLQHRAAVMMKALVENLKMINRVDIESKIRKQEETARRKEIKQRGDMALIMRIRHQTSSAAPNYTQQSCVSMASLS